MKFLFCIVTLLFASPFASAQWIKQSINTTASFRGLSVVNEKIVWASGTEGTVVRTIDGGKTWKVMHMPEPELLDYRDIEAFDAYTAYVLSIGHGDSSRIYKTVDGGKTWNRQFTNYDKKAFFDAIACWDKNNCIAMSDPVDNKFVLINTTDGGRNWKPMDSSKMPPAKDGEAAFAASGTCLITQGKNNAFIVTGGSDARVFKSIDRGKSWSVYDTPMVRGTAGSGIFSIAMRDDKNGVIVGGNYEKDKETSGTLAFTTDGGMTWKAATGPNGYRSAVTYLNSVFVIAVGSSGSDRASGSGTDWRPIDEQNFNSVRAYRLTAWAVGPKGLVANIRYGMTH